MRKIVFIFLFFVSLISFSQKNDSGRFSEAFINKCIADVYGNKAVTLDRKSKSNRIKFLFDLMRNRIVVVYEPNEGEKDYKSTNVLKVFSKYNKGAKNDVTYNKNTFNPLKYINSINLNSSSNQIYRIANSDYLMIVLPSI